MVYINKKVLLALTPLLIVLIIGGLWFFNSYEIKSVLKLPPKDSTAIEFKEGFSIDPVFYINSDESMNVNMVVGHLSDSIYFKSLQVSVISMDNPGQSINLNQVLAYADTICNEDLNRSLVSAISFDDLPEHYRWMWGKRDFNALGFSFETKNVDQSDHYKLSITGTIVYKGATINFNKQIRAVRKKEFVPIQMMT